VKALALVALVGCAAEPSAAPSTSPIAYFVGHWSVSATMSGQAVPFTYDVRASSLPGWLSGEASVPSMSLTVRDVWYVDELGIARIIVQSDGASGMVQSPGWVGNRLVLEGFVMLPSGKTLVRETITKQGPQAFEAVWESKSGGTWTAYSVERLTR